MFKIHDDKVYFVAETPDINKVIEIFLPKDDRGTIMDSHEIRVDLCRAVIHMEKKGVRVLKVRNIYNGLPLHTEYRVFVDFDTKEILGASPYWRSDVMKNEFKKVSSPQERHDYVVYKMHEDILNQRYHESVQTVLAELKKVIPRIELTGQWSVDVMRNGNDYYIIDMALAENSALNDCVPSNRLRAYPQQWLPGESNS